MAQVPIYTIGHGNRSIEEFIELLRRYQLHYLVDVRSQPYSRYAPHFSKSALEHVLRQEQFHYIFMGDVLGGRPNDSSCFVNGKVDYALIREKSWYQQGIQRLHKAWEKQLAIALLCSELKPQECHRAKLIGNTLLEQGLTIVHIDERGDLREQQEINELLSAGQTPLFEDLSAVELPGKIGRARKRVQRQEER